LLEQLVEWHFATAAQRYFFKQNVSRFASFSVREIIRSAYGMETDKGYLDCKAEIMKDNVLRLLPCITQGRPLPADIVQNLVKKASAPLAYEKCFRTVLETACGMIRKHNIDRKKGVISMAYDPNETDRSYLFGCLLAIADAAESAAYDEEDRGKRVTNAKRYWSMFAKRPFITWGVIENNLRVYMTKLGGKSIYYERMLNDVMCRFKDGDFQSPAPLSPAYLLGYHHFNAEIYKKKEED
jgi:CRISPR-associated protein Csd1